MKRDNKGTFKKDDKEGYNININIPSIKTLTYLILFIAIIFPWIVIGAKFELLKKIMGFFEELLLSQTGENGETTKKVEYFINQFS